MQFSRVDVIGIEKKLVENRRAYAKAPLHKKLFNAFLYPRDPKHSFYFSMPQHLYSRALLFCEDIAGEVEGGQFDLPDLVEVLYTDFLEHFKRTNDLEGTHKRLLTRELAPAEIKPYQSEEPYKGVLFEESRTYELVTVALRHKEALRGEWILRDMMELHEHAFKLESVLEVVVCDFIDDFRRGYILNPMDKILFYIA